MKIGVLCLQGGYQKHIEILSELKIKTIKVRYESDLSNIDGLIIKERYFPSESKLLYKSASGCMEHLNIFIVPNINSTLKFLRDNNFWIYGFDAKSY